MNIFRNLLLWLNPPPPEPIVPMETPRISTESLCTVIFTLGLDKTITVEIELNTEGVSLSQDAYLYKAKVLADFLNIINTGKLEPQMKEILLDSMTSVEKRLYIEYALAYWNLLIDSDQVKQDDIFILPSQVFSGFMPKHNKNNI